MPLPLPDEIIETIEAYLDSHHPIDDHDSQRLQDDLETVYSKHVAAFPEKHGAFVNALRHLSPAITSESSLEHWWTRVIRPTIDAVGHKRETIDDAKEFLLGILVYDVDEDKDGQRAKLSACFAQKLLDAYLTRTKIPSGTEAVIAPEDDFVASQLESVLVTFGRRNPKEFLLAVDGLFVQRQYRAQALGLLNSYAGLQPPHLHLVLETSLIDHLHKCLLYDNSSTVVDLAATILLMFAPHITKSLVMTLPTLFIIYSRLLCWDSERSSSNSDLTVVPSDMGQLTPHEEEPQEDPDQDWEVLNQSFDNVESCNPRVDYFFTFMYGLFPLNLMAFIRKPRKYLKANSSLEVDDYDLNQDMIRTRTETHRRVHLLHPNFYLMTPEEELNDSRWIKYDAADIVTDCLNLCTAVSASLKDPGPPPTSKLPAIPKQSTRRDPLGLDPSAITDDEGTLNNDPTSPSDSRLSSSWRNTQSTALTSHSSQSQSEPAIRALKSSRANSSHSASRSSRGTSPASKTRDGPPDSPTLRPQQPAHTSAEIPPLDFPKRSSKSTDATATSPRLQNFTQALSTASFPSPPTALSPPPSSKVASLQRENMLLRNDLNFERYLKQQHLSHIGQLQRKHIREATAEADTQNLINTNKALKAKLMKASEQYTQLKKETAMSRSQSKKFEADLTAKVKSYKDEERLWQSDEERLKLEVETLKKDLEILRRLLAESEQRELKLKNSVKIRDRESEELAQTREEVEKLKGQLHEFEENELHYSALEDENEKLQTQAKQLKIQLNSKDTERERARRNYELKIKDLEAQLDSNKPAPTPVPAGGQLPPSVQQMLDNALSSSQARFNQLKKTHQRLLNKYTELEMRCAQLEGDREFDDMSMDSTVHRISSKASHDFDPPAPSNGNSLSPSGSISGERRRPHAFSESLLADVDEIHHEDDSRTSSRDSASTALPMQGQRMPPARLDSLPNRHMTAMERAREKEHMMQSFGEGYERNLSGFLSYNPTAPLSASSARSTTSGDSKDSGGKGTKPKVSTKSDVRVYGRG